MDTALLNWASKHSTKEGIEEAKNKEPIPKEWRDAILKTDADRMKDAVNSITDDNISEEEKVSALEDLQFLVEILDNANDLHTIGGFVPVIELLTSAKEEFVLEALWILANCVQNNPKCQEQFLTLGGVSPLLGILSDTSVWRSNAEILSKAIFLVSGFLKHNEPGLMVFSKEGGWDIVSSLISSSPMVVRRKLVFLIGQLAHLFPAAEHLSLFTTPTILAAVASGLSSDDDEMLEKCLDSFIAMLTASAVLKSQIRPLCEQTLAALPERIKASTERDPDYTKELLRKTVALTVALLR